MFLNNLLAFFVPMLDIQLLADTPSSGMSFTDGMTAFGQFISGIMSAWTSVITQIVTAANWILILPVFTYIFVVATSSLRSFYKG